MLDGAIEPSRAVQLLRHHLFAGGIEARSHHRHQDGIAQAFVHHGPEDYVGFGIGGGIDYLGDLIDLVEGQVGTTADVQQDAAGTFDGGLQKRGVDGRLGGLLSPLFSAGASDAHVGRARPRHDGADVGQVEVDEAGDRDQIAYPLDTLAQHVVGETKRRDHGGAPIGHLK